MTGRLEFFINESDINKDAMRQKEIHSMLIYANDNTAGTSAQITKVT